MNLMFAVNDMAFWFLTDGDQTGTGNTRVPIQYKADRIFFNSFIVPDQMELPVTLVPGSNPCPDVVNDQACQHETENAGNVHQGAVDTLFCVVQPGRGVFIADRGPVVSSGGWQGA